MKVLKRKTTIALILVLIVIISTISAVFFVQNLPKPPSSPHTSPTPITTSSPIENSPKPTISATLPPTYTPPSTALPPTPLSSLFPGEVSKYQGQDLTPIGGYIDYLYLHPDVAIHGRQNIDKASYHLAITGLVNNQTNYTYDEIVDNFNSTLEVATLPCVEGWSVTLLWQGVPVSDLLQPLGISQNATTLIFLASDGYSTSLPLDYVKQNNITIAYKMNNVTLTPTTGFPFFLVAKNQYGYKWIEWLTEINVSNDSNYLGYWESRGYPNNATVLATKNATPLLMSAPILLPVIAISIASVAIVAAVIVGRRNAKRKIKCP
jgi:DMSO/TMAO reductase YedYZ molybdopterin-dependent catalytic subunit